MAANFALQNLAKLELESNGQYFERCIDNISWYCVARCLQKRRFFRGTEINRQQSKLFRNEWRWRILPCYLCFEKSWRLHSNSACRKGGRQLERHGVSSFPPPKLSQSRRKETLYFFAQRKRAAPKQLGCWLKQIVILMRPIPFGIKRWKTKSLSLESFVFCSLWPLLLHTDTISSSLFSSMQRQTQTLPIRCVVQQSFSFSIMIGTISSITPTRHAWPPSSEQPNSATLMLSKHLVTFWNPLELPLPQRFPRPRVFPSLKTRPVFHRSWARLTSGLMRLALALHWHAKWFLTCKRSVAFLFFQNTVDCVGLASGF